MLSMLLLACVTAQEVESDDGWSWALGEGWRLSAVPAGLLYPTYVADPRRPTFSLTMIDAQESEIDAASDRRYGIRMGTRFGILRLHPQEEPEAGFQLAGELGFLAQFDREMGTDNIGWDGLYGFHLAWRSTRDLVLRVGISHDSSHVGDEYIENTGRERIEYTREEWLAGLRYTPVRNLNGYLEYGQAYDLSNEDLMERGRVQLGLELEPDPWLWNRRLSTFAALDLSAYEEDDWEENLSVQVGLVRYGEGRRKPWRLGLEFYDGRSPIGEFFQDRERHLAWGIWFDL